MDKDERLKSNTSIKELLQSGKTISCYPFKIFWKLSDPELHELPVKIAISIPKKNIRRAVDRNLIKRGIREVYRKNKYIIFQPLQEQKKKISLLVLYLPKEILRYNQIEPHIIDWLKKLAGTIT